MMYSIRLIIDRLHIDPYPGEGIEVAPSVLASQTTATTIDPLLLPKLLENRWRNRTDLSYPTDRSILMIMNYDMD
jgi:hypothetical protein